MPGMGHVLQPWTLTWSLSPATSYCYCIPFPNCAIKKPPSSRSGSSIWILMSVSVLSQTSTFYPINTAVRWCQVSRSTMLLLLVLTSIPLVDQLADVGILSQHNLLCWLPAQGQWTFCCCSVKAKQKDSFRLNNSPQSVFYLKSSCFWAGDTLPGDTGLVLPK